MMVRMRMIIATNMPIAFDHDFENALKAAKARPTHKAMMNIWTIEMVNGPIGNEMPANRPLFMFLG